MSLTFLEKKLQEKKRGWQRRYPRHRADFAVKAAVLRDDGYVEVQGRCADIGHGGMGTVFTAEIVKGEVLSLEFQLPPDEDLIAVRAIVRYRKGFVHGLEFLGLTVDLQVRIDAFCAKLVPIG